MFRLIRQYRALLFAGAALLALPTGLRLLYTSFRNGITSVEAAEVSFTPFTLTLKEVHRVGAQTGGPPTKTARTLVIAQRGDGTRAELTVMFPGQPQEYQFREITLSTMQRIRAADSVGLKSTSPPAPTVIAERKRMQRPSRQSDCTSNHYGHTAWPSAYRRIGKEAIGSLQAVKFVREDPHTENWRAPQLDCETVRNVTVFRGCCDEGYTSDPRRPVTDSSEVIMVGYSLGEPDDRFFDVSALKEAPPSKMWRDEWRKALYPEDFIERQAADLEKQDSTYWKTRDQAGVRPE